MRDRNSVEGGSVTETREPGCFLHLLADLTDDNPRFFQDFLCHSPTSPSPPIQRLCVLLKKIVFDNLDVFLRP